MSPNAIAQLKIAAISCNLNLDSAQRDVDASIERVENARRELRNAEDQLARANNRHAIMAEDSETAWVAFETATHINQ